MRMGQPQAVHGVRSECTHTERARHTHAASRAQARAEAGCIALQLQRLFVRLQTAGRQGEDGALGVQAVETTAVSQAFGWDEAEAFTQHDVQELLRVLFDALEEELKGTPQAEVLKPLY
jgi:ubiquitin carboxyl-terminal hydrolase 47